MHNGGDAARFIKILHVMRSRGAEFRDIGRPSADFIKERRRQFDAYLVGDRRQVQHGVGRAADAHIHRNGILKRFLRHNIARADSLADEVEDDSARMFCEETPLARVGRRNRAIPGKSHAEYFR